MQNTYSQLGKDIYVINKYNKKTNGFFIEIGASDGIKLSNTYLLEKKYNWTGICIEPELKSYEKCVVNRPNSICLNCAVYSENDLKLEFNIASNNLLSGIISHVDCHFTSLHNGNKIIVQTKTLNWVLDNHYAPNFIEYLSLDTEGSELEILKVVNFDKYKFGIIDVEHNYIEPRRTQIRELLLSKGYNYDGANQFDDRYSYQM